MNIKFFTGSTDFPDYRSITSATNTKKTSAGRKPVITIRYHLTSPLS